MGSPSQSTVPLEGRLLVDGGTLDNVPADVAKNMGADVVVAVNVSATTDGFVAPTNFFDVLGRTMDTMMAMGMAKALQSADLIVVPDLRGFPGTDYRRSEEFVERGYQAGAVGGDFVVHAKADRLIHVSLPL